MPVEINVDIDADKINEYVAQAVLKSAIGTELQRIIDQEVKRFSTRFDNPIVTVVRKIIADEIRTVVHEQFSALIKEKVITALTEEKLTAIIDKAWSKLE